MPVLNSIAQELLPHAQNAPEYSITKAVLDACRIFCTRSKVWRLVVPAYASAQSLRLSFDMPRESELVNIGYIADSSGNVLDDWIGDQQDEGSVILEHGLVGQKGMCALLVLRPAFSAKNIDDKLYSDFGDYLRHGALYLLKSQHGREWFEPQIALFHQQEFEKGIGTASRIALQQYIKSPARKKGAYI